MIELPDTFEAGFLCAMGLGLVLVSIVGFVLDRYVLSQLQELKKTITDEQAKRRSQ